MEFISKSPKNTQKIADDLAKKLILKGGPSVIVLYGDLGSGKTTFAQFFAKSLGVREKVLSPTFVIMKTFEISDTNTPVVEQSSLRGTARIHTNDANRLKHFVHVDTYRLKSAKDLVDLGFEKMLKDSESIILIEWPEKIEKLLPKNTVRIYFETINENSRRIIVK